MKLFVLLSIGLIAASFHSNYASLGSGSGVVKPSVIPQASTDHISYDGVGPTTISLYWAKSGDLFFSNYQLQESTAGSNGPWTTLATITDKTQTTEYVYDLSPGTTYWWQIVDTDSFGSATSNALQATQADVASLSDSQPTSTSAQFTWTNNAVYGGLVAFDTYELMEAVNGGSYSAAATITTVSTTSYTINGLSAGTGYSFYLVTTDKCSSCSIPAPSSSNSNTVSINTPVTLSASAVVHPASVDAGQLVSFSCISAGGSSPYTYAWNFGDGFTGSGQTASHSYSSPGTMNVVCTVTDGFKSTASSGLSIVVSSDPSASLPVAHPSVADTGQTVVFTTQANGGSGGYSYAWVNLPTGCNSADTSSITCQLTAAGTFRISSSVTDSNGYTSISAALSFVVDSDPTVQAFTASPTSLDLGQTMTFVVSASGGRGSLSYAYSGLPPACTAASTTAISCSPSSTGTYSVTVTITDTTGFTVVSNALSVTVNPDPTINPIASSSLDLGQQLTLDVSAAGTGQLSYSYTGLPPGCTSTDKSKLSCTPSAAGSYLVGVTVTDQTGKSVTSSVTITVGPYKVLGLPPVLGYSVIGGGVVAIIAAIAGVVWTRSRKQKTPNVR